MYIYIFYILILVIMYIFYTYIYIYINICIYIYICICFYYKIYMYVYIYISIYIYIYVYICTYIYIYIYAWPSFSLSNTIGPAMRSCVWRQGKPCIGVPLVVEVTTCCGQCAFWCVKVSLNILGHVRAYVYLCMNACKPCMLSQLTPQLTLS